MKQLEQGFLGKDNIWKLVLRLAIPSMLAQFVNVLYTIVDRIYISNMPEVGATALAAVGVCGPIVTLVSSFANLVGLGGAPLMAIRMGEGNKDAASRILSNGFLLLSGLSILLTIVVIAAKGPILRAFGASGNLYPLANEYLTYYCAGSLFAILAVGLNCYIIAQGFAKIGMLTVVCGALVNIILDPVFIFAFHMGVKGAAITTVISQFASASIALGFLLSKKSFVPLRFRRPDGKIMLRIVTLGFSPFIIIATDSAMILALNSMLQKYGGAQGDMLIAAATIMLSFMQVITMPLGGITGGTQPILSYNYGACFTARVKKSENCILITCLVFTTVMFLIAQLAGQLFARIFTSDPELIAMSVRFIRIYTMMIIPLSFQYAYVDGLTALGIAPIAISLSLGRKIVVMLTLTLVLPAVWGAEAVFYAEPIADLVAAICSATVYWCVINRILRRREASAPLRQA